MRHIVGALLAAFAGLMPISPLVAQPKIWGSLKPGPHAVGYRSEFVRDATRSFFPERNFKGEVQPGDRRRPLPLRIWYPARAGTGSAMRYSDYLPIRMGSSGLDRFVKQYASRNEVVHKVAAQKYASENPQAMSAVASARVHSRAHAEPKPGRFPVVVYGGGAYNSVDENVILAEFLASYGLVVAMVPAQHFTSISGTPDALGVETQARDMELALARTRELSNVDADKVATAGFSIGGAAALLLAMRNNEVDGVVALDSSITSEQYNKGLTNSPYYHPTGFRVPLLDFRAIYPEGSSHALNVLDALRHSDRYSFIVRDYDHLDFNNFALAIDAVAGGGTKKGRSLQERRGLYEAIAGKTLQFLKGIMSGSPAALRDMRSPLSARGAKLADATYAKAAPPSPSAAELLELFQTDGHVPAIAVLNRTAQHSPEAPVLLPGTLNTIGYALLQEGRARDAVELFRFNLSRHPDDLGLHDSLAEGWAAIDKACAAKEYAAIVAAAAARGASASQQDKDLSAAAERQLNQLPPATACSSL